jgi:hypothetical protein
MDKRYSFSTACLKRPPPIALTRIFHAPEGEIISAFYPLKNGHKLYHGREDAYVVQRTDIEMIFEPAEKIS